MATSTNLESSSSLSAAGSCAETDEEHQAASTKGTVVVQPSEQAQIPVIPFAVALPDNKNNDLEYLSTLGSHQGIVGSIALMKNSAMIWLGWGHLNLIVNRHHYDHLVGTTTDQSSGNFSFGKGRPKMGQLVVAMPRTQYKGAFSSSSKNEASCSQLIGSDYGEADIGSDDSMVATQMASRLSIKSGMAIYVSCQLVSSSTPISCGAVDRMDDDFSLGLVSQRAAALAEKEIWKILQEHASTTTGTTKTN